MDEDDGGVNDERLDNKNLARAIGLKVERRVKGEAYDAAYEALVSVAISRKNKLLVDAFSNLLKALLVNQRSNYRAFIHYT